MALPERERLAQLPTPLEFAPRLTRAWGGPQIWMKRDDLTGFGLSGNKIRKLELHCAAAREAGATTLLTCGAVQSNHCRATALAAARLGFRCVLFLRSSDGAAPASSTGNHLLQRLAGAAIRYITPAQYQDRVALMAVAAAELRLGGEIPWVIPEGASDHLGMLAFELAMDELAAQVTDTPALADAPYSLWHASSSAGTTAGLALGVHRRKLGARIVGVSVGDTEEFLTGRVRALLAEADDPTAPQAPFEILDGHIGPGYGRTTQEQLAIQVEATRLTGLIWDPTYTGKAIAALKNEIDRGRFGDSEHVIFWHTGGGFAVFAHDFGASLAADSPESGVAGR